MIVAKSLALECQKIKLPDKTEVLLL